jgi:hypothetical protein
MSPDQERILKLEKELKELQDQFFSNNFPGSQDFNKYVRFNGRLKVPHHDSLPTTCEIGEVAETGGELYICSAADTWTVAGTQS